MCACLWIYKDSITSIPSPSACTLSASSHSWNYLTISWQRKVGRWQETNIRQTKKTYYIWWKNTNGAALQKKNMLQQSREDYITFPWKWWVIVTISIHGQAGNKKFPMSLSPLLIIGRPFAQTLIMKLSLTKQWQLWTFLKVRKSCTSFSNATQVLRDVDVHMWWHIRAIHG